MRATQGQIAKNIGVSQQAVSKALRGDADISDTMRQRVEAEARRLDYHANKLAQSLISGTTDLVGLYLPIFHYPFYNELFGAVEKALTSEGHQVLARRWTRENPKDDDDIAALLRYGVDGLIISPRSDVLWDKSVYASLAKRGMPIISISEKIELPGLALVTSDDLEGGMHAARHLLEMGHRRIAFCGAPGTLGRGIKLRHEGFARALREAGIKDIPTVPPPQYAGKEQAEALDATLRGPGAVTAFFCQEDYTAMRLLMTLQDKGLSVPDDVSVIGYGDSVEFAEVMRAPLTTVSQHGGEIGTAAVGMLLRGLSGQKVEDVLIPTELVRRGSVKDLRRKRTRRQAN